MASQHSSLHHNHVILHVKPQKKASKVLQFKQEHNSKETIKRGSRKYHKFFLTYLFSNSNYLEPHKYISHLKQLKSIRYLTVDLAPLYLAEIPAKYTQKIFDSLKYLKKLSVIHFELKYPIYVPQDSSQNSFCQALPILNCLPGVQVKFSFHVSTSPMRPQSLRNLFETFSQLERLTAVSLRFSLFFDLEPMLQAINPLKKSKSLVKFSFNLESSFNCTMTQLQEFLLMMKEIKSLKHSELLFNSSALPGYNQLKTIVPLLQDVAQNGKIDITFQNCRGLTNYQMLLLKNSIAKIKSFHKIKVKIPGMGMTSLWCFYLYIFLLFGGFCCTLASIIIRLIKLSQ